LPHCAMVDALIEVQIELFWPASFAPKKNCPPKGGTKKKQSGKSTSSASGGW